MSFFFSYLRGEWAERTKNYDSRDLAQWQSFLKAAEDDRRRDRILQWRDRTAQDDFAVNADEPEYYRRTAMFVWRFKDQSGLNKARNHQYAYNLEVFGHQQFTRRSKAELAAAQTAVEARVVSGELGPLSPLEQ